MWRSERRGGKYSRGDDDDDNDNDGDNDNDDNDDDDDGDDDSDNDNDADEDDEVCAQDGVLGALPRHPPADPRGAQLHRRQALLRLHGPGHQHLAAQDQERLLQVTKQSPQCTKSLYGSLLNQ